ncbi:MAG: FHA domain-containing protein [Solirubrobacterales bacterium]
MDDPIAVALKFAFLLLLFLFIVWVVRSSSRDLVGSEQADFDPLLDGGDGGRAPIDLKAGVRPRLVVVAASRYETGSSFDLLGGLLLGRDKPAEVIVDDVFASARHARITARGPYNYLEDLGSTNGTYLNGARVEGPQQLHPGDKITIGDTEFRYEE